MDKLTASHDDPDPENSNNSSLLSRVIHLLKRTFWLVVGVLIGLLVDDPALPFTFKSKAKVAKQNLDVLIIGAGISGIAIAKVKFKWINRDISRQVGVVISNQPCKCHRYVITFHRMSHNVTDMSQNVMSQCKLTGRWHVSFLFIFILGQ